MASDFDGTVFFRGEGKRRKLYLRFTTRNGKIGENPIGDNLLSYALRQAIRESLHEQELDVKVRERDGRPTAIFFAGESDVKETVPPTVNYRASDPEHKSARPDRERRYSSRDERSRTIETNVKREFHNPYNFVPAIPREEVTGELGDRPPTGHDRFEGDKLTGKLTVGMTVETPLVVLDTSRIVQDGDHKRYPVRVDDAGKPHIAPTAIKGMLRTAYEAVTNSRLSVFTKHNDRLAFRAEVNDGLLVVPARIDDGKVFLYNGTSSIEADGRPKTGNPMYAAWVRKYMWHGEYANSNLRANHGDRVWAYINRWSKGRFELWNVVEIQPYSSATPPASKPNENRLAQRNSVVQGRDRRDYWRDASDKAQDEQWVEGYYCQTGRSMRQKHDERVFFVPQNEKPIEAYVPDFELLRKEWKRLIENYQEEHEGAKPDPPLTWSRHITGRDKETELDSGTLCYARVRAVNSGNFEVLELYPVMISRRLHKDSPEALLEECLKPATHIDELSPADRVFGWVNQKGKGAYRGQLRIGSVECGSKDDSIQKFNGGLPLNILGQPKPQQGRFYVGKNKQGDAQDPGLSNEEAGYKDPKLKGLRGRKVYPHHSHIENGDAYWFVNDEPAFKDDSVDLWNVGNENSKSKRTYFREYLRPRGLNKEKSKTIQQRDKQNRSIEGWVTPGTQFRFELHFSNLSDVELGALLWLLDLNKFAKENGEESSYFHRFGSGKPFGFGSVTLEIDETELVTGKELHEFYGCLEKPRTGSSEPKQFVGAFLEAIAANEGYDRILESFKFACRGFVDGLPIHYPRARRYTEFQGQRSWLSPQSPDPLPPHAEGLAYEWFVENNKRARLPLAEIAKDEGLPLYDHRKSGR